MAQLRGDSTVGGKPIVTLDMMNEFVEQMQGVGLKAKINKYESTKLKSLLDADVVGVNREMNGIWSIEDTKEYKNMYPQGQLTSFSNLISKFQLYAPEKESTKSKKSALYFRTGNSNFNDWERVATKTMLDEELSRKFDKTGGTISGAVAIENGLQCEGFISHGPVNWLKCGTEIGIDRDCGIVSSDNNGLSLYTNSARMIIEDKVFKYNGHDIWHSGNFHPEFFVSRDATLLRASTNLDNVITTGYYRCENPVNVPSKITDWVYVEVIRHDDNNVLQKIYSYNGQHTYSRTLNHGIWNAWRALGGGLSATRSITSGNWSWSGSGVYEMTVTHDIGSENISSVIVTDENKMSMFTGFQVISPTVIKVFSSTNPSGKIVINAIQ